jgi:hypothetical protein
MASESRRTHAPTHAKAPSDSQPATHSPLGTASGCAPVGSCAAPRLPQQLSRLHQTIGNQAVSRMLQHCAQRRPAKAAGGEALANAVGSSNHLQQAQSALDNASNSAPTPPSPDAQFALADTIRASILQGARFRLRQVEIACSEQADPNLLLQALPFEVGVFVAWLGFGPWDDSFCTKVTLVRSDLEKNLSMTPPPPYFVL